MGSAWLWGPAIALAAAIAGAGWRWGALRSATWAATAVIGQAAILALVKAGPLVGYQHLASIGEAARERPFPLLLSLAVLLVAGAGVIARRAAIAGWIRTRRRWMFLVALGAGSLLSAAPSSSAATYAQELVLAALFQLAFLACVVLAAIELPDELVGRIDRWLARSLAAPAGPPRLDRFAWILAAFVTVVSAILCLASYQAIPHIPDEIVYLIQARYFAAGMPWMSPPPVPAAFDTFLLEVSGNRWYGVFPPGWPLVLAIGVRLGVPFLVNPVLGGVCVLLLYLLVQELADRGTARITAVLLAASPWHLLLAMSFMSHTLSLALALIVAIGATRAWRDGGWRPALVGGLALGILGMSRPLEGVAVGLLAGVPLLVAAVRRSRAAAVAAAAIGTAITGGLGLAYNRIITGSPWVFPAERLFDREYGPGKYGIGFGAHKGVGWTGLDPFPGHGPVDVVVNSLLNGFMVNIDLFGWAVGSVAIVMLGLMRATHRIERVMVATVLTIVLLHGAYWFSGGPDFGARYWFLIIAPCALLAARALATLEHDGATVPGARTAVAAGLLSLAALVVFVPWRASDKYFHYRGVRNDPVRMAQDPVFRNGLVLVSGQRHQDWGAATNANEIEPGRSVAPVFAWDRDPATRQALLDAFPTRPVWLVRGPSETGRGFEVLRGPVPPEQRGSLIGASGAPP